MPEETYGIFSPTLGLKQDFPTILLSEGHLPLAKSDSQNYLFHNGEIQSAKMRLKSWTATLPDTILHYKQYKMRDATKFTMACTKRDIAYRDTSNDRMNYLTKQYAVGVVRVENGSAVVNGGLNVDDCDDDPVAWVDGTAGSNCAPERETTIFKENTASVKLPVLAGAGVENLAYHDISSIDLTTYDSIGFWFRSSVALDSGDLTFEMGKGAGLTSITESINLPAISADTWTWVNLTLADPTDLGAIVSIGLAQAVDKGAMTLYIDQIVAGDWAGQLKANDFFTIGTTYSTDDTWYTIQSVDSDTQFTLTANYAGSTAYQQAYLARVTFTGGDRDYWRSEVFNNKWIATNNAKDNPVTWDGSASTVSDLSGSPPKFKYITVYEGYLVVAFTVSGGNDFPQKMQWPAIGDETAWASGDSGSKTIDGAGHITGFGDGEVEGFKLLLVEDHIQRFNLVSGDEVFHNEVVTRDIGVISGDSAVNYNRSVYAWCSDNTFRRITLSSWNVISRSIDTICRNINPDFESDIQGIYEEEFRQIMWLLPSSDSTAQLDLLVTYDVDEPNNPWAQLDIAGAAFGNHFVETAFTWDTLPYSTWDTWAWDEWNSRLGLANFPWTLVSDYSGGSFQLYGDELDNTAAYTRAFVLGSDLAAQRGMNKIKRLWKVRAYLKAESSGTLTLEVKRDEETSWQSTSSPSLVKTTGDIVVLEFTMDYLARHYLFRFSATNKFRFYGMIAQFDPDYGDYYAVN